MPTRNPMRAPPTTGETGSDEESDDESEAKPESQATQEIEVTVKGEDGAEETIKVPLQELKDGYLRRRDYTQKTEGLADRERQIAGAVHKHVNESRQHYVREAQLARAAVLQLAGLRSPADMAQLAAADPTAWVAEKQREEQVLGVINALEQGITKERKQSTAESQQQRDLAMANTWKQLSAKGIDKPKLVKVFETIGTKYGYKPEDFGGVTDARMVLLMADAAAYHALKAKKPEVQAKAQTKLPPAKQAVPKNERVNKELSKRFQGGRADLRDLGAWLSTTSFED